MLLVYGSKDSLLPRICAVEAVGIGANNKLFLNPYLKTNKKTNIKNYICLHYSNINKARFKHQTPKNDLPTFVTLHWIQNQNNVFQLKFELYLCVQNQGSKKPPSGCPGQVDFSFRQVTFSPYLPQGQGPRQAICQLNFW